MAAALSLRQDTLGYGYDRFACVPFTQTFSPFPGDGGYRITFNVAAPSDMYGPAEVSFTLQ